MEQMWLSSLYTFKNNPSVLGFLVEQACLSSISETGFRHGALNWNSLPATIFDGIRAIPPGSCEIFFVPDAPNFKDIDALYLRVDKELKTVLVVPIQITVAKAHKDSEAAFYSRWSDWQECFEGYTITTTFVWIVEDKRSWEAVEEKFKKMRSGSKLISPEHNQLFIKVVDLYPQLGWQLGDIRRV